MTPFATTELGDILKSLNGYYIRPSNGPLVGYAGTYKEGKQELNYVGEEYANFAVIERKPRIMDDLALRLLRIFSATLEEANVFLGAPEGGKSLADKLARINNSEYCYPDVIKTPTDSGRPKKEFVWKRHELTPGSKVVIVEDVANNFSTTEQLLQLITDAGCRPIAITCLLNRSTTVDDVFKWGGEEIPVCCHTRAKMEKYRQDDIDVISELASENIVWEPRESPEIWQRLMDTMKEGSRL